MFYLLKKKFREIKFNKRQEKYKKYGKGTLYIDVRHMDYWWGLFGLRKLTDWEDVLIYSKIDNKYEKLGYFCISSRSYIESSINEMENESDFLKEASRFINSDKIKCHLYYDKRSYKEIYEVPHQAKKSEEGLKPSSIEMWVPQDGIDFETIKKCVSIYGEKFLDISYSNIEYKEQVKLKAVLSSLFEDIDNFEENRKVYFSDAVINNMSSKLDLTRKEVERILGLETREENNIE